MLPLLGDDLDSSTLHLYLKDSTFVEYFNSFLLLPAFSSRLFFDQESGYFEPVHSEGTKLCWEEAGGEVTPSSSLTTLYLTDENMGPALDHRQSWSWIVEHRLPLFLKSDVFSEYKLCKLLCQRDTKRTATLPPTQNRNKPPSTPRKHCSDNKKIDTGLPLIRQTSSTSIILEAVSTTSLQSSTKVTRVSLSSSDVELTRKKQDPSSSTLNKQSNQSMEVPGPRFITDGQQSRLSDEEETKLLGSKSGMNYFWRFLRGKAGEKNWSFWLDAERIGYHSNPLDQQRLLRELHERYLHSSGPLALPAEIRNKARVNKTSRLTLSQLRELQQVLVEGLRDYWCPRFLIHYQTECADNTLSIHPHTAPHTHTRPHSCAPLGLHITQSNNGELTNYRRISTPLTPTGTPAFRRITSGRNRSYSSPISYRRAQEERGNRFIERYKKDTSGLSEEGSEIGLIRSRGRSRRVWDKDDDGRVKGKKGYFDRVAKYTMHHVPDSNSRCASTTGGQLLTSGMCENKCSILSVSGTPVHTVPPTPSHSHTITAESYSVELYGPLINCLNTEHRKAGGYFQQHLENNDEKVFIHCLVFWREVQEYKALFIGASFSPCTVETRAKSLYGRFISQGSDESINCPQLIVETVYDNLWPAYEDLFDSAEEHALGLLLLKWVEMVTSEDQLFQKLDCAPVRRPSTQMNRLPTPGELEEFSGDEDESGDFFLSPSSSRKVSRPRSSRPSSPREPPARQQAVSLNDILRNRVELDHFKMFLNEHCAAQDLMCWMEIEAFRGISISDKTIRNIKAKQIRIRYFTKDYLFGPNSPASKEAQRQIMQAGGGAYTGRLPARPCTAVFIEAQKYVRTRLEKKWLMEFMVTPDFLSRHLGGSLLRGSSGRKVSRANYGKENSIFYETSFSNTHEAITFRKLLYDKIQREMFLRYLDIKAINAASARNVMTRQDVKFWLEVQKFKEMCHAHTTEMMLSNKSKAIIDFFFQSSVPPRVQVDVPVGVADELAKRPHGPYLFREAQAAVFKHLYSCWLDYRNYASGYTAEEMQGCLDRLESQLLREKTTEKDRKAAELEEEEKRKLSMPRFETLAEKMEKARIEQERDEIGDVQVAFRLSSPDHSYTYYTALPEEFVEQQCIQEHLPASNKPVKTKEKPHKNTDMSELIKSSIKYQQRVPNSNTDPLPMVVVKPNMSRDTKKHEQATAEKVVEMDLEQTIQDSLPLKPTKSHQELLFQRQASSTFFHSKTGRSSQGKSSQALRRLSVPRKNSRSGSQYTQHTTISMRRSGEKGGLPYLYAAGLPKEQSSITVTNLELL